MEPVQTVNCAEACVNGCILGDRCPNRENLADTAKFIAETSLDDMHAIAEAALRRKMMEPPKWILPED
jgi:hypothetical protein